MHTYPSAPHSLQVTTKGSDASEDTNWTVEVVTDHHDVIQINKTELRLKHTSTGNYLVMTG